MFATTVFCTEYVKSSEELESKVDDLYSPKDYVLYFLDSGMLNYYEGNWNTAVEKLNGAENYINEYYAKSITQNAASLIINDSVIDYPGEDYENIFLNLFKALAYYNDGQMQEGFHELNAYRRKAQEVSIRHDSELLAARQAAKLNEQFPVSISFHDSALGEWLSMLYYRSIKDSSLCSYSARMIKDVFLTSPDIYSFSVPRSVSEELRINSEDARMNFVAFSGISPRKHAVTERYSDELILSLPELEVMESSVRFIKIRAVNKADGTVYTDNLEQIEDFSAICEDVFEARSRLIYYKAVARAVTKASSTVGLGVAGNILSGTVSGTLLSAGSVVSKNINEMTEQADLRHSNYFPARADIGGITVKPGIYDVMVSYCESRSGNVLYEESFSDVKAAKGKLNLVTSSSVMNEIKTVDKNSFGKERSVSVRDSIEEADRLYFDIGTEPEESASSTYGFIQYNWIPTFASNFNIKYTTSTKTENEIAGYGDAVQIMNNREFEFDLHPVVILFGNKNRYSVSIGGSYQYIYEKTFAGMFDVNGYMLDPGDEGKYFTVKNKRTAHLFAPRIGFTAEFSLYRNFVLNFETYANPVYFLMLNQSMSYYSDQTSTVFDYSGDNSISRWTSPYIDAKFSVDIFRFVRLMTSFSYQRLDFQQIDWSEDGRCLKGYDDIQSITKLRFGIELLAGNFRRAKVKGGIYYQNTWNSSTYNDDTSYNGKWTISIGTER